MNSIRISDHKTRKLTGKYYLDYVITTKYLIDYENVFNMIEFDIKKKVIACTPQHNGVRPDVLLIDDINLD